MILQKLHASLFWFSWCGLSVISPFDYRVIYLWCRSSLVLGLICILRNAHVNGSDFTHLPASLFIYYAMVYLWFLHSKTLWYTVYVHYLWSVLGLICTPSKCLWMSLILPIWNGEKFVSKFTHYHMLHWVWTCFSFLLWCCIFRLILLPFLCDIWSLGLNLLPLLYDMHWRTPWYIMYGHCHWSVLSLICSPSKCLWLGLILPFRNGKKFGYEFTHEHASLGLNLLLFSVVMLHFLGNTAANFIVI